VWLKISILLLHNHTQKFWGLLTNSPSMHSHHISERRSLYSALTFEIFFSLFTPMAEHHFLLLKGLACFLQRRPAHASAKKTWHLFQTLANWIFYTSSSSSPGGSGWSAQKSSLLFLPRVRADKNLFRRVLIKGIEWNHQQRRQCWSISPKNTNLGEVSLYG